MKKLLTAAAAVSILAAATPSLAQALSDRADRLDARIELAQRAGEVTFAEADRLRDRLRSVERLEDLRRANGLTAWGARDLDRRYDEVAADLRLTRDANQYRYERDYDYLRD